jgi:hypothetical protein
MTFDLAGNAKWFDKHGEHGADDEVEPNRSGEMGLARPPTGTICE